MSATFERTVAALEEMFPQASQSKIRTTVAAVNGQLDAAVEILLDPNAKRKRKLKPDIRSYFGCPSRPPQDTKKLHIDSTIPSEFLHPNKQLQIATFESWNAAKESQRPILLTPETLTPNVPCLTIQMDFLPADQANAALREMLETSGDWIRTKWVIFEREVESPHHTQLYGATETQLRQKEDLYTNTGTAATKMKLFTPTLHAIKMPIDDVVNRALSTRERHPLEAPGPWHANLALGNLYKTPEQSVGPHSDTMTELGPRPTIASYTLGAERIFRIKRLATDTTPAQTFNLKLPHNSLLIMFPPFQEFYRHEVPAQQPWQIKAHEIAREARVNLTFRMTRPNYMAHIPRCQCNKPAVLRTANRPNKKNVGEYFYICAGSVPASCTYFCWLKDRMHLLEPTANEPKKEAQASPTEHKGDAPSTQASHVVDKHA
ncbi:hypothetical protein LEN26_012963 [Aphanomyces euteiches]|nr:hypothetical protein LEN26_012963 [Aphanomyces euteiches]KAH9122682.1 hypothetical protein AeMF1_006108 [Aphanomyces euteiches]KAH9183342.1 hypothetical protein AeNC1_014680 [Aphanomyces euteiches]